MEEKIITGSEMLKLTNNSNRVKEIKKDKEFYMVKSNGVVLFYSEIPKHNVCVVLRNSDFTEGAGSMLFHKVFKTFDKAVEYILTQSGIYGSSQGVKNYSGIDIHGEPYCVSSFNGYDIKFATLE